jgi:hypothetical protein
VKTKQSDKPKLGVKERVKKGLLDVPTARTLVPADSESGKWLARRASAHVHRYPVRETKGQTK